ncbi:hypothetical protein MAHJHV59_49910 [Mycobacterium avium subsp. hominissuis]
MAVLAPSVDETPAPLRDAAGAIVYPGFPADVLYEFRLVSLTAAKTRPMPAHSTSCAASDTSRNS